MWDAPSRRKANSGSKFCLSVGLLVGGWPWHPQRCKRCVNGSSWSHCFIHFLVCSHRPEEELLACPIIIMTFGAKLVNHCLKERECEIFSDCSDEQGPPVRYIYMQA